MRFVEQRYKAVREVLEDGATVTDVALRYGVVRQTVHDWLRRYASGGLEALTDRPSRPGTCPHQIPPEVEARILQLRRSNPGWGPRTIVWHLAKAGTDVPGRSSVARALVRHGLIEEGGRRRRRTDYRRWERSRSMELWQIDVVGRIDLTDGTQIYAVTGIDDHSRYCVMVRLIRRATADGVCAALMHALRQHGVPENILTDNGKVFTGRFATGGGIVRFDRICNDNGIKHLLTAPYSPTTTGKIERLHKMMRAELLRGRTFASIEDAQVAVDEWVERYNEHRPHQSIGDVPPVERFRLSGVGIHAADRAEEPVEDVPSAAPVIPSRPAGVTRWVDANGKILIAKRGYQVGKTFSGELVEAVVQNGLVRIFRGDVLVATHAQKRGAAGETQVRVREIAQRRPRAATSGITVTRKVDANGTIYFAGETYRAGKRHCGLSVEVSVVAGSVQIALDGKVIRIHPARHNPKKEHGAYAVPRGRPPRKGRVSPSQSPVV